jgi:hypothetical protein
VKYHTKRSLYSPTGTIEKEREGREERGRGAERVRGVLVLERGRESEGGVGVSKVFWL